MVYIFLADGFETNEALTCINYLRRAKIDIKSIGLGKDFAMSSHNIKVMCDMKDSEIELKENDAIILPGGLLGVENISLSETATNLINAANEKNLLICAICAAPTLLAKMGLLSGKRAVCYPDMKNILTENGAIHEENLRVVKDKNFITSIAAGSSEEFAFEIIKTLSGEEAKEKVKKSVYSR